MNRRLLRTLALIAVSMVAAAPCAMAQAGTDATERDFMEGVDGFDLSLDDCLRFALENNLELVAARKDPEISEQDIQVKAANFDPTIGANARFSDSQQLPVNVVTARSSSNASLGIDLTQNFGIGGNYKVEFFHSRNDAPDFNFPLNPVFTSGLGLTFNFPLLRGQGKETTKLDLFLSRRNLDISRENLRSQAETTMQTVEGAYWDLLASYASLDVANQALARAQDQLQLNTKKVEVGTLPPIDITQAEAQVASQQEGVIVAEVRLRDAADTLRELLAIPWGDPLWSQSIIPTDRPVFEPQDIDLTAAIGTALEERPELASRRQELLNRELQERVAKKNARHGLDFTAGYSPSAQGGQTDSLQEFSNNDNYDWSVGLVYSYPFNNRAPRANRSIARLNREKTQTQLDNQVQAIRVEVRKAVRNVESGVQRVNAARTNTRLQREKLKAEEKKFENGMSTSFEVLTFQNDLADAQLREIEAALDYVKALAALERAKGTLLDSRGFSLETGTSQR